MRLFISAAFMAIIASAATTRGLSLANQLSRYRCGVGLRRRWPPSSSSWSSEATARHNNSRRRAGLTTTSGFPRRAAASSFACFVAPDGATTEMSPTAAMSTTSSHSKVDDDDDGEEATIERTARESLSIVGSLPAPSSFGGIPYLDTSSLDSDGSHRVIFVLGGPGAGKGTQSERIVETYKCVHLSVGELLRSGAEREDCPHAETIRRTLIAGNIVPVELSLGLLREAMDEAAIVVAGGDEGGGDDDDDDDDERYGSRIFLVDGFPRNYDNVRGWTECMPGHASVLGALVYDCPMEELERRILGRAETSGRSDDNLESARRRFDTFRRQTMPVVRALERAQEILAETDNAEEEGGGGFSLVVDGNISVSAPAVGRIMGGGGSGGGSSRLDIVKIDAAGSVDEVWKATKAAMDSYVKNDVLTANSNLLSAIEEGDVAKVTALSDDDELLEGMDPMMYDGPSSPTTMASSISSLISNGRVDIVDGIKAIVSYDRKMKGGMKVRETRVWKHGPRGWKCVGVTRV